MIILHQPSLSLINIEIKSNKRNDIMKSQLPFLKIWTKYPDLKRQPNKISLQPLMVFPNICQIQRIKQQTKTIDKKWYPMSVYS